MFKMMHLSPHKWLLLLVFSLIPLSHGTSYEDRAHVLIRQEMLTKYIAERQNMTVKYTVVNVGSLQATDIRISIPTWPSDLFETTSGEVAIAISSLLPNQTFSSEFTAQPKSIFKLLGIDSRAQVKYSYVYDDIKVERLGKSNGFPDIQVLTFNQYQQLTATFTAETVLFIVGSLFLIVAPLGLYTKARRSTLEILKTIKEEKDTK